MKQLSGITANILLSLLISIFGVLCFEVASRIYFGEPLFTLTNYRVENAIHEDLRSFVRYDALLGWVHRPNYPSDQAERAKSLVHGVITTLDHGIRSNGSDEPVSTGGILVVGSSFAAGSGVRNTEHWPAVLEKLTGTRTYNASTGGWAMDQVVLRAQSLLGTLDPEVVILQSFRTSLSWVNYSILGSFKPYFTIGKDGLVAHNNPVPRGAPKTQTLNPVIQTLISIAGYLAIGEHLIGPLIPDLWQSSKGLVRDKTTHRAINNGTEVSCRLLESLKERTDREGRRLMLVSGASGTEVAKEGEQDPEAMLFEGCAEAAGIQVVKTYPVLRDIALTADITRYYGLHKNSFGHWSVAGHDLVAELVAAELKLPPPSFPITRAVDEELTSDIPRHRLPADERRHYISHTDALLGMFALRGANLDVAMGPQIMPVVFKLLPAEEMASPGEPPSIISKFFSGPSGTATFSLNLGSSGFPPFRIEISQPTARLSADLDPLAKEITARKVGKLADVKTRLHTGDDGDINLSITANYPGGRTSITLALSGPDAQRRTTGPYAPLHFHNMAFVEGGPSSFQPSPPVLANDIFHRYAEVLTRNESLPLSAPGLAGLTLIRDGTTGGSSIVSAVPSDDDPQERYVAYSGQVEAGWHVLSLRLRPTSEQVLRLQFIGHKPSGVGTHLLIDLMTDTDSFQIQNLGNAAPVFARIQRAPDEWINADLFAELDSGTGMVIVQMMQGRGISLIPSRQKESVLRFTVPVIRSIPD